MTSEKTPVVGALPALVPMLPFVSFVPAPEITATTRSLRMLPVSVSDGSVLPLATAEPDVATPPTGPYSTKTASKSLMVAHVAVSVFVDADATQLRQ